MVSRWRSIPLDRVNVPRLYRSILKAAQTFPSIKRDGMIADIKNDFRVNKGATDPEQLQNLIDVALNGLQQLQMYTDQDPNEPNWSIKLLDNPLTAAFDAAEDRLQIERAEEAHALEEARAALEADAKGGAAATQGHDPGLQQEPTGDVDGAAAK